MGKTRRLTVGERLAVRLEETGLNQSELSARLGVFDSAVSRWISNKRRPSLRMAIAIEKMLGIPAESWLEPKIQKAS